MTIQPGVRCSTEVGGGIVEAESWNVAHYWAVRLDDGRRGWFHRDSIRVLTRLSICFSSR